MTDRRAPKIFLYFLLAVLLMASRFHQLSAGWAENINFLKVQKLAVPGVAGAEAWFPVLHPGSRAVSSIQSGRLGYHPNELGIDRSRVWLTILAGDHDASREALRKVTTHENGHEASSFFLGNLLFSEGLQTDSVREWRSARAGPYFFGQAERCASKGLYSDAVKYYDIALMISPGDWHIQMQRGKALLNNGERGKALHDFTQAYSRTRDKALVANHLAHSYISSQMFSEAKFWCESIAGSESRTGLKYSCLGEVEFYQGHHDDALRLFEKALQINPHDPSTLYWAGRMYLRTGRPSEAARCLKMSAGMNRSAWVFHELARAYMSLGDCGPAIEALQQTLGCERSYPYMEIAREELNQLQNGLYKACKQ